MANTRTRFRIKDHWAEQRLFMRRSVAAGVIMVALLLVLISKLIQLQIFRHDYYADLSQGNRVRLEPTPPNRGVIEDRNGVALAQNLPTYQLEVTAEEVPNLDDTLLRLSQIQLIAVEDIPRVKRMIRSRRSFEGVPIRLQMPDEDVARFAVHRHDFPGVDIRARLTRHYPFGELGVHALGYVAAISERDLARIDSSRYAGTSLIGKIGLEYSYENDLHGTPGFRQVLVNAQGRPVERESVLQNGLQSKAPVSGKDLVLSLDIRAQRAAEEGLKGMRGAVVALDPNNGDVIAFASAPGFDPNHFGRGLTVAEYAALQNDLDLPLLNRAIRGEYPPGSTIKPIMAFVGLHYNTINPNEGHFCRGFFTLPGSTHRYRDWKPAGHGWVNMEQAIAQSCDTYFYKVANILGIDRIAALLSKFGLGEPTGLDIGGERRGLVPTRAWKARAFSKPAEKIWFPGETVIVGIGQGYLLTTPMQLAHATAIIASHGKSFKPRLVTAIRDPVKGTLERRPPQVLPPLDVGKDSEWQHIVNGMVAVTQSERGTARASAAKAPYVIAGKTGTAQVFTVGQTERYNEKQLAERLHDHALFIAFAPAEAPRIAIAVLVENGKHGASTAAPIARKVMDAWLLPPEEEKKPEDEKKPEAAATTAAPQPAAAPATPAAGAGGASAAPSSPAPAGGQQTTAPKPSRN